MTAYGNYTLWDNQDVSKFYLLFQKNGGPNAPFATPWLRHWYECIIKKMWWYETECKKNVPLVKQNVMKFEVFILGRERIDQKRKKGWGRGRREEDWEREQREDRDREKRELS